MFLHPSWNIASLIIMLASKITNTYFYCISETEEMKDETIAETSTEQNTTTDTEPANETTRLSLDTTFNNTQASVDPESHS